MTAGCLASAGDIGFLAFLVVASLAVLIVAIWWWK